MAKVADFLAGEAFCDSDAFEGPVEDCADAVAQLIPLAFQVKKIYNLDQYHISCLCIFQVFAAHNEPENNNAFCQATLGVC